MAYDVYITHSPEDQATAALTCTALEESGLKCWIASRNLDKRRDRKQAVSKAILNSKIFVIVFSNNTNKAKDLADEMNVALNAELNIIPLRVDQAEPEGVIQYYLADTHWFDVENPPTEEQLQHFIATIKQVLDSKKDKTKTRRRLKKQTDHGSRSRPRTIATVAIAVVFCGIFIYGFFKIIFSLFQLAEAILALSRAL
jgi:hypothetical protein